MFRYIVFLRMTSKAALYITALRCSSLYKVPYFLELLFVMDALSVINNFSFYRRSEDRRPLVNYDLLSNE